MGTYGFSLRLGVCVYGATRVKGDWLGLDHGSWVMGYGL